MKSDVLDTLAVRAGGRLESWMTNPPKPAKWHFTPAQRDEFARLVAAQARIELRAKLTGAVAFADYSQKVQTSDGSALVPTAQFTTWKGPTK